MHRALRTILVVTTGTPAPMVPGPVTRIDDLHRDRGSASDAAVVGVEAGGGELKAGAAGTSTVRGAAAVQGAIEDFLVHGGVVDASAAVGPFP